jgi:hypothetical protein
VDSGFGDGFASDIRIRGLESRAQQRENIERPIDPA